MDFTVRTGRTKTTKGIFAAAHVLPSSRGETVCLLMEAHGEESDVYTLEKECLASMEHSLLEAEGAAPARLDGTLKELNGLLKGLLLTGSVREAHMLIALLEKDGQLHLSHAGRAEGYLVRQGTTTQITEYVAGKPMPAFVHISSGELEERDIVVLSTQRLLRVLTPVQVSSTVLRSADPVHNIIQSLEAEGDQAAIAIMAAPSRGGESTINETPKTMSRLRRVPKKSIMQQSLPIFEQVTRPLARAIGRTTQAFAERMKSLRWTTSMRSRITTFVDDLKHPDRKKRAHLLLLTAAVGLLIVIWASVHVFTVSQRSKTKIELKDLVNQIEEQMKTAQNRHIIGDTESANKILEQAEQKARQVRDNESGLYRSEAIELLGRITSKRDEINNTLRVASPHVTANIAGKEPSVQLIGFIGLSDGEFLAYDRQGFFRILLNSVDARVRASETDVIVDGTEFPRFQSQVFLTNGNSIIEVQNGQASMMKTDDADGWIAGTDVETYQRNIYILNPDQKKIFKYERLSNQFAGRVQYNVNGDLTGAIDMAIDGNVYVLKNGGEVLNFLRGEVKPFSIKRLPPDALKNATKILKSARNFYFLAPAQTGEGRSDVGGRIIVTSDGGTSGESVYQRQYIIEGEQIGKIQDLFVDTEESHLYVADDKRIYMIDLLAK